MRILRLIRSEPSRSPRRPRLRGPGRLERFKGSAARLLAAATALGRSGTLFLAGSHPAEARQVSPAEARSLRVDGLLLCLSMWVNAAVWVAALLAAGKSVWVAAPVGLAVASIIGLFDRQILSATLAMDGEALKAHRGQPGFFPLDPRRKKILVAARIVLSVASMWAAMLFARIALFATDIEANLDAKFKAENAQVRVTATQLVDSQIADLARRYAATTTEREGLVKLQAAADAPANTSGADSEIETVRADIARARGNLDGLARERAEHLRGASAESSGVVDRAGDSGRPGEGNRWAFHQKRAADLLVQINLQYSLMRVAEQRLAQLLREREQQIQAKASNGQREREVFTPRIASANHTIESYAQRLKALQDNRPAAIEAMMAKDPAFVPRRTGLMDRVTALEEVTTGSWSAWTLALAITAVASILELAVVWSRAVLGLPHPVGYVRAEDNRRTLAGFEGGPVDASNDNLVDPGLRETG